MIGGRGAKEREGRNLVRIGHTVGQYESKVFEPEKIKQGESPKEKAGNVLGMIWESFLKQDGGDGGLVKGRC